MDDPHYNLQSDDSSHKDQLQSALEILKNEETDLSFITQDGQNIKTHKFLICLYSESVASYLNGIPCCKDTSISLPVSSLAINNLLKVLETGGFNTDITMEHEEVSDVTEAANILGIVLQNIDFLFDNEETNLDEAGMEVDRGIKKLGKNKVKAKMGEKIIEVEKTPIADEINEFENDETNLDEAYNDVIKTEPEINIDGSKKKLEKIKLKAKVKAKMKKKIMQVEKEPVSDQVISEQLLQEDDTLLKSSSFKKAYTDTQKCPECEKMFSSIYIINRHIITAHTGEKPFACDQCGKCFSRKDKMKTHEKTHDGENTEGLLLYKCNICTKSFKTEWYVKTHERNHTVA